MYKYEEEKNFEKAIKFFVVAMSSNHNSKPVMVHSFRVAFSLYNLNYDIQIVISALLHDLIEDTDTSLENIRNNFGDIVAELVDLLTMNEKILDYKEQYITNFDRLKGNRSALIIRCADMLDNAPYINLANVETQSKVREKQYYFYKSNKDILKSEPIFKLFEKIIK